LREPSAVDKALNWMKPAVIAVCWQARATSGVNSGKNLEERDAPTAKHCFRPVTQLNKSQTYLPITRLAVMPVLLRITLATCVRRQDRVRSCRSSQSTRTSSGTCSQTGGSRSVFELRQSRQPLCRNLHRGQATGRSKTRITAHRLPWIDVPPVGGRPNGRQGRALRRAPTNAYL
jgi:hypothetical protein